MKTDSRGLMKLLFCLETEDRLCLEEHDLQGTGRVSSGLHLSLWSPS